MSVSAEPKGRCSPKNALGNSGAARTLFIVITRTLSNVTKSPVGGVFRLIIVIDIFGELSENMNLGGDGGSEFTCED